MLFCQEDAEGIQYLIESCKSDQKCEGAGLGFENGPVEVC